jgi:hypothetical protein
MGGVCAYAGPPRGELTLYRSTLSLAGNVLAGAAGIAAMVYWFIPPSSVRILIGFLIAVFAVFTAWHLIVLLRRAPRLVLRLDALVGPGGRAIPWSDVTALDLEAVPQAKSRPSKWLRVHVRDPTRYLGSAAGVDYIAIPVSGLSRTPDEILRAAEEYWRAIGGSSVGSPSSL